MTDGKAKTETPAEDWNAQWAKALMRSSFRARHRDLAAFWDVKASAYCRMEATDGIKRARDIMGRLAVTADTTILEIGSGPGTLTIPLARAAKQVTAVDPSKQMLYRLQDQAEKARLTNIHAISRRWEDVEPGRDLERYDIVIASYALAMPDLEAALIKMDRVAAKAVCLYWYAEDMSGSVYSCLWPKLFNGEPYTHFPDYLHVINILHRLGIYANVHVEEATSNARYADPDEAVAYWQQNFGTATPEHTAIIKQYLSKRLVERDGAFLLRRKAKMATIFWEKR